MEPVIGFGIEAVHLGGRLHARNNTRARSQIERRKFGRDIGRPQCVDTTPDADQSPRPDGIFNRLGRHDGEQLPGGCDATIRSEDAFEGHTGHAKNAR